MGRNYRKKRALEEEEDTEDPSASASGNVPEVSSSLSLSERLEDTKMIQKLRKKEKGVNTEKLSGFSASGVQLIQVYDAEEEDADGDPEQAALQDTFAGATQTTEEDPAMMKYIEDELRKRRGLAADDTDEKEKPISALVALEKDLYNVPEHLKVAKPSDADATDRWMTGITEVQLPVEHRLATIEATEKAKIAMLNTKRFKGEKEKGPAGANLPSSLSSNYKLHTQNFMQRGGGRGSGPPGRTTTMQEGYGSGRPQRPEGFQQNYSGRKPSATDDIVASRFRARERARFQRN